MKQNFRDISRFNPKIKKGVVFRSSALCLLKSEHKIENILKKYNINTIIDLRAEREVKECDYKKEQKTNFEIINAPFDP